MNRNHGILLFFVLLKFALQYFALNDVYELHRDEFLHLDLGKHLAVGYLTVPPVTGFLSYLIILLGNSVFWVKFFPALFGALTTVVVWKVTEVLGGGLYARIVAAIAVTFSVLLRINTLYQPNSLEYLCWTLLFYTVIRYTLDQHNKWLWRAAIVFALGFLNKYNIVFLVLGLVPAILLTPLRSIFGRKSFYQVALTALVLISPNLFWQAQNGFPVLHHLQELAEKQLVNFSRLDFLLSQLLFFAGALWLLFLAFVSFLRYTPHGKFIYVFWCYISTMVLYLIFQAKGYYTIGLYPVLLAFGAVYLEHLLRNGWWRYLRLLMAVVPIIVMITMSQLILPILPPTAIVEKRDEFLQYGLLRWEDGKDHQLPQDFADMLGWKELASIVDSAFTFIPDHKYTLIQCDNYGQAGAINYYGEQLGVEALTLHADYINWYRLDEIEIDQVVLVKSASDDNLKREQALFREVRYIGEISNQFARERGTKVYLLSGATKNINKILAAEIEARKLF